MLICAVQWLYYDFEYDFCIVVWKGVLYEAEGNAADGLADYHSDDGDYCPGYGFWQFADDRLCVPGGLWLLAGGAGGTAVYRQPGKAIELKAWRYQGDN